MSHEILAVKRAPSLRLQAVEQLRQAIITSALEPGSIHSEQAIATRMSISRTPVREALLQLEREGLVEFIPQRGVRIRDLDPEHLTDVFALRAAIEGYCAAMLAAKHKPEVLTRLENELKRQRAIIDGDDHLAWVLANMDFHTAIVGGIGNQLFNETLSPLATHTMRIGYRMIARRKRMEESFDEHAGIVDAIRRGDADKARERATEHMYVTVVLMKQLFSDLDLKAEAAR
ncbi:MAG: GntR family transcriptional regulator [Bradyrhizobiaceae bacterium]|nr:GntR family transcriptional regulator [Bradyrhizobiaceae bacterium]